MKRRIITVYNRRIVCQWLRAINLKGVNSKQAEDETKQICKRRYKDVDVKLDENGITNLPVNGREREKYRYIDPYRKKIQQTDRNQLYT